MRTRKLIDNAGADAVVEAALAYANERGHRVVVAVVDPAGELIELRRTEGAQVASSRVAVDKARTAAIFVRPSRELEEQVSSGRLGALALHGASALTGGIPLIDDGQVVGAVGVSGETPAEDEAVAAVDADGQLLYLWRPDEAQVASVGVATDKARTASIYRRPSKDFEDQATGGGPAAPPPPRSGAPPGGIP